MKVYFQLIVLMLLAFQVTRISGQTPLVNFNEPAPLDESITYGKLDNGLTYYIKPLPESQEKVNLHFYIKAGSKHQDPDQLNMAHFVEHMAFKSSVHFPYGIFYETKTNKSLGMGQYDVNGSAGSGSSRYNFDAPADNKEALETGLLWFKDIATGLHFKEEEIDTERGVLVQELLFRTSSDIQKIYAERKLSAQMIPCGQNYSNFMKHHETFDSERLRQFYKDWYRPDLMAIAIVGNIEDVEALEKQIRNQFSDIPPKENPREQPNCEDIFFNRPPRFIVVENQSDTQRSLEKMEMELSFRDQKTLRILPSLEGVKRMNKIGLLIDIINNRLSEVKGYGSFFDIRMQHTFKATTTPSSFKVFLSSHNNSEKESIQTFTRVLEQVKRFGVTESEFIQAKVVKLSQLEKVEVDNSRYWIDGISNYFIYGEIFPSDKQGFIRNWLSDYDSSEFKKFIEGIDFDMPDIGVITPANHPALSYKEEEIRSWINEVYQRTISPYVLPETPINLMNFSEMENLQELPYEDKGMGESGAREIKLANGVKVFLKSFKPSSGYYQNKIMLHGFNNRGALDFPATDYFSAINAPQFIKHSGVAEFDKFELRRHFSTNSLVITGINLYVNNQEAGIKSDVSPNEVEKMLQLVYLSLTQPREDSLAFADWKIQQALDYQSQYNLEQHDFSYNIRKFMRDNSVVSRGTERHLGLEETDMTRGFEIYNELFGNTEDFTFIISGDFQTDAVLPLVNKYLGNLPSVQPNSKNSHSIDVFSPKPIGPVLTQFKFPDSYTKTNYMYWPKYIVPGEDQYNWKEKLLVRVLGRLLNVKIWALRTEKGYSLYSVNAYGKYDINMNQYEFSANFNCSPKEYPLLRQEFSDIIIDLKSELVSQEVLNGIVHEMQNMYEGRTNTHRYIHGKLYNQLRFDEAWIDEKDFIPFLESLIPENILNAARKYFKDKHLYEFVMMN